jgi:symplekin
MAPSVQEAIRDLITALIRSLGSNHARLLTLLRSFPPGAESLALRILTILTEKTRPSAALVSLVKTLILERNLDARFLIPIIAEMDKADIQRYLPRIVATLNGNQEEKHLVRSVFGAIVTTPPQSFGTVSSNLPRVRQSELLTPAELMILLHGSDINLKSAIEGEASILCFCLQCSLRHYIPSDRYLLLNDGCISVGDPCGGYATNTRSVGTSGSIPSNGERDSRYIQWKVGV